MWRTLAAYAGAQLIMLHDAAYARALDLEKGPQSEENACIIVDSNHTTGALSSAGLLQACWRCGARWQPTLEP